LDAEGVRAAGVDCGEAIRRAHGVSAESFCIERDGEPVAAWGYALRGPATSTAYGWLLTSPGVEGLNVAFVKHGRAFVQHMLTLVPRVEVQVLHVHHRSLKWLVREGFHIIHIDHPFMTLEKVR
jgi:hypothetical protein